MFFPLGDEPNFSHIRPLVNWALIAANVAVFALLKFLAPPGVGWEERILDLGFVPVDPSIPDFFTSMFMHADWMHLGGNMLFLWIFGDNVEGRLGHLGYLLMYLACGLAAVLLFRFLDPRSPVPLVGASGAIFGVQGYYWLAFRRNRVKVIYFIGIASVAWIPARIMIGISFVTNLFLMLRPLGEAVGGGVAYAAHVGGGVFGFLIALAARPFTPADAPALPFE